MKYDVSQGFSLIEVLISLMLFSLMLLGIDAMGYFSLHAEKDAWTLTVATNQLLSMTARLRSLSDHQGLKTQITRWNQENLTILPGGVGSVAGKFPEYVISLHCQGSAVTELEESIHL